AARRPRQRRGCAGRRRRAGPGSPAQLGAGAAESGRRAGRGPGGGGAARGSPRGGGFERPGGRSARRHGGRAGFAPWASGSDRRAVHVRVEPPVAVRRPRGGRAGVRG
ncbi:unnamed protein product, partial [Prorocentrum cordatum]